VETALVLNAERAEGAAKQEGATASGLLASAQQITIATAQDYEQAGAFLKQIKSRMGAIEQQRVDMKKPALELGRKIDTLFGAPLALLKRAESAVDSVMREWRQDQERKRVEEEARLRALALEEEERLRTLADHEAVEAETKGHVDLAEAIRESVPPISMPTVQSAIPKIKGLDLRLYWHHEVTNLMALAKGVVAGEIPSEAILENHKFLGQKARDLKDEMKWPGVRVWSDDKMAGGR